MEKNTRMRVRKQEKNSFAWQVVRGVLRLIVLVLLLTSIWYGTRFSFFTITDMSITGGETISHEDIRAHIETELQGTYFHLIPKRFSYLYPHDRIIEVIGRNERLYNIEVTRPTRKSLAVHFDEYVPYALFCAEEKTVPCYFMTQSGYAFAEAPSLEGGALVRHMKVGQNEIKAGAVISEEVLAQGDLFIERLEKELDFRVSGVLHSESGDTIFYVNGGGMIYTNAKKDVHTSFDNLKAVLGTKEFSHIKPGNFRYIDVRFDNKAYVNETVATSTDVVSDDVSKLPE